MSVCDYTDSAIKADVHVQKIVSLSITNEFDLANMI